MRSLVIVLVILVIFPFNACSQAEEAPLPPDVRTLNVCEAAIESVEARVRISGIFDGFGYSNKSLKLTLKSDGLCNDQGAGLAFVTLRDESEREKLFSTLPGEFIIIEGTINRIEETRFVYLEDAIVIARFNS